MASRRGGGFSVEEVLEQVLNAEGDADSEEEKEEVEEDNIDCQKLKLEQWVDTFDGGEGCDNEFFRENAKQTLLPIVLQSFLTTSTEQEGKFHLFVFLIN